MTDFRRTNDPYPEEMRTQLWPLCCGAKIISGFKNVAKLTKEELVKQIKALDSAVPDSQVYQHEGINPNLTYMTLNSDQWCSAKIREAVQEAGFVLFATAKPRGSTQYFLVKDKSETFKLVNEVAAA